ncbi:unnamed protein product, partial [Mycena citricolor]
MAAKVRRLRRNQRKAARNRRGRTKNAASSEVSLTATLLRVGQRRVGERAGSRGGQRRFGDSAQMGIVGGNPLTRQKGRRAARSRGEAMTGNRAARIRCEGEGAATNRRRRENGHSRRESADASKGEEGSEKSRMVYRGDRAAGVRRTSDKSQTVYRGDRAA